MTTASVVKYALTSNTWTKIADNVTSTITFLNAEQSPTNNFTGKLFY